MKRIRGGADSFSGRSTGESQIRLRDAQGAVQLLIKSTETVQCCVQFYLSGGYYYQTGFSNFMAAASILEILL